MAALVKLSPKHMSDYAEARAGAQAHHAMSRSAHFHQAATAHMNAAKEHVASAKGIVKSGKVTTKRFVIKRGGELAKQYGRRNENLS